MQDNNDSLQYTETPGGILTQTPGGGLDDTFSTNGNITMDEENVVLFHNKN